MDTGPLDKAYLKAGSQIGRYEIERLLRRGVDVAIYRAVDSESGEVSALKTLRLQGDSAAAVRRFERIMPVIAWFHHPHIVDVWDYSVKGDRVYIFMPFVEGTTLRDKLSQHRGGLPRDEAFANFEILLEIMDYVHERDVLHLGLTPRCILFDAADHLTITDLGIAAITGNPMITVEQYPPLYLAPEQLQGQIGTRQSDLYTLSLIFYEMLTGEMAFAPLNATEIPMPDSLESWSDQILAAPYIPIGQILPDFDPRIDEIIKRNLNADPNLRYSSAREMLQNLRESESDSIYDTVIISKREQRQLTEEIKKVAQTPEPQQDQADPQPQTILPAWLIALIVVAVIVALLIIFLPGR